ncbi:beta-catenin-like protein 1 [Anneissia japonica]|uniref:beta-catenin-like protein 1 n=1 Tax=Anneissia japonica TaxID=1529436 RepID=UPI001425B207|nr:beta-catenin-like protein 1 [Anneissia japonica]
MDVGELLSFNPDKPDLKRKSANDEVYADTSQVKKRSNEMTSGELTEEEREKILRMVEQEPDGPAMDEADLRQLILRFEKKVYKNQEMRIKFPDQPEKFMASEIDLNDAIQEMHVIATNPNLYHYLVTLNAAKSLLGLISHGNTDISIAMIDLLQELTDVDALNESEEGAEALIDALLEDQIVATLVQNLDRLDDSVKEESEAIHTCKWQNIAKRLQSGDIIDDDQEDEYYLRRLDAGLFTLQLIDYIMLELSCSSGVSTIKQRILQLLNMHRGSITAVRNVVREYAGNIGDAKSKEHGDAERQRLLELVNRF